MAALAGIPALLLLATVPSLVTLLPRVPTRRRPRRRRARGRNVCVRRVITLAALLRLSGAVPLLRAAMVLTLLRRSGAVQLRRVGRGTGGRRRVAVLLLLLLGRSAGRGRAVGRLLVQRWGTTRGRRAVRGGLVLLLMGLAVRGLRVGAVGGSLRRGREGGRGAAGGRRVVGPRTTRGWGVRPPRRAGKLVGPRSGVGTASVLGFGNLGEEPVRHRYPAGPGWSSRSFVAAGAIALAQQ
jgi:hypothetical protein